MRTLERAVLISLFGIAALPAAAADPFGRLFTTPEQRRALDARRDPGADAAVPAGRTPVVLNGVVRRSRGPDVVWVNGSRAEDPVGPIRLRAGPDRSNGVTLEDTADGATARLKPGQYWEPATGLVANCYGCGPVAPAPEAPLSSTPAAAPPPAEGTADKP